MNMRHSSLDVRAIAAALGGDVASPDSVLAPGPNHKPADRSLSVKLAPGAPDGFTVHSFAGNDWRECKEYVRQKLGLPDPRQRGETRKGSADRRLIAEYVYRDQAGVPVLKVMRFSRADGGKDFRQMRCNDGEWEWGKPKGPKLPYRLPEILRSPHAPVFVVEGEKDVDRLAALQLVATTCSEGAGKWTEDLARWFKGRTVFVLPDNDEPGRAHARQVAQSLHQVAAELRVVSLPGLPEKGDVSDWLAQGGDPEELMRLCDSAPEWTPEAEADQEAPPLRILSYDEMLALPEPQWLVRGLLMNSTSALLFGPSNNFKSFLAVDIACSVATGQTWHGHEILEPGPVLYIATEGAIGIAKQRIPGWMEAHGVAPELRRNVFLYPQEIAIDSDGAVDALLKSCAMRRQLTGPAGAFRLMVVDIFGASMNGPETTDETARAWVRNLNRILREMGCAVLTVAHTGWMDQTRARMHTHFWGSFDTRLKAEGNKEARTTVLMVDRHKDADSDGRWAFRLDSVTLPNGKTTLHPLLTEDGPAPQQRRVSGKPAVALQALSEALIDQGVTMTGSSFPACPVVPLEQWSEMCRRHGLTDTDTAEARKKAFQRAKGELIEKGLVRQFDSYVWKVHADA